MKSFTNQSSQDDVIKKLIELKLINNESEFKKFLERRKKAIQHNNDLLTPKSAAVRVADTKTTSTADHVYFYYDAFLHKFGSS